MDMLLSPNETMSFQEMIDFDIRSEIDNFGYHGDCATLNFTDTPPIDLDESPPDINMWFTNTNSNHSIANLTNSSSNFNIDFIGSEAAAMMVNPNSVMPTVRNVKSPSPKLNKSVTVVKVNEIKADLFKKERVKIAKPPQEVKRQNLVNIKSALQRQVINGYSNVKMVMNTRKLAAEDKYYPKPAYSYSCLIAMALKNSRTGSLPVSEIYNFMCEHFPYFKTAPNGWKNSVRHNLSLNKCFEKIEKPAISGAQRKGCLWAMNPAKINKMDEEVQKWSRKDPSAIRKAMMNPEHLELLERGELKYNARSDLEDGYGNDSSADTEEEELEEDEEIDEHEELDVEYSFTDKIQPGELLSYININDIEEDEVSGYDIEVADTLYDQDSIKIEMEIMGEELTVRKRSSLHDTVLWTCHSRTGYGSRTLGTLVAVQDAQLTNTRINICNRLAH